MSEAEIPQVDPTVDAVPTEDDAPVIHPKAAAIESRFLYVDVAALRAKQLRRGALPRLDDDAADGVVRVVPHKAERVAMEEVKRCLVLYEVPDTPNSYGPR